MSERTKLWQAYEDARSQETAARLNKTPLSRGLMQATFDAWLAWDSWCQETFEGPYIFVSEQLSIPEEQEFSIYSWRQAKAAEFEAKGNCSPDDADVMAALLSLPEDFPLRHL